MLVAIATCWSPPAASAQESLSEVLDFLLTNRSIPTGDFARDALSTETTRETISRQLLIDLTTSPLSSGSTGFSYRFNPSLGTVERASSSFGPLFTERSLTLGRRQASFGLNLQTARYTRLDDYALDDGSFVTTANQFRDETQPFDAESLTLTLRSTTVTLFSTVGLNDRIDVGVAVPLVRLSLDGARVNTYFGARTVQARAEADASGVGDLALRSKVQVLGDTRAGLSVLGEARLPTGAAGDLLGTGDASFRGLLAGSFEPGRLSAHGNLGVTVGGLSDELTYRGAVAFGAVPQLTLFGELLGRRLGETGTVSVLRAPHPTIVGVDTLRLVSTGESTTTVSVIAGARWNVSGNLLLNANVSVPLTKAGLRPQVVTLVGLDYAFGGGS